VDPSKLSSSAYGQFYPFAIRKLIHILSGSGFIWVALQLDSSHYILGIFVALVIIMDLSRNFIPTWNRLFLKIFRFYLKPSEMRGSLSGASTLWAGLYVVFLLFKEPIFILSAAVMVFADSLAGIIGKIIPLYTFPNSKSIGGSGIFLITSFLIFWQYGNIPLIPALLLSIISAAFELILKSNWENFLLGIGTALSVLIYFQLV
jgi:dolichol kinase